MPPPTATAGQSSRDRSVLRNPSQRRVVYPYDMARDTGRDEELVSRGGTGPKDDLPAPSAQFRRRSWLAFQRALDPLAPPKPMPIKKSPPR